MSISFNAIPSTLRVPLVYVEIDASKAVDLSVMPYCCLIIGQRLAGAAQAAGVPVRVGYRRKFGWLLNRGVRLPRVVLAPVAHQHYLLREAGFMPDGEALEVWPSLLDEEAERPFMLESA